MRLIVTDILRRLAVLCGLCLAQALVLNHIRLFGCAMPLLYVYMTLRFPIGYQKWAVLLWSFAMGVAIDTFTNTPGVAAASLTLVGAVQPHFFSLFVQREAPPETVPSMRSLGPWKLAFFVFSLTLLHCLVLFALELFGAGQWLRWLECTGGSALLTTLVIMAIEGVRAR